MKLNRKKMDKKEAQAKKQTYLKEIAELDKIIEKKEDKDLTIMDRVQTIEDAFKIRGLNPAHLPGLDNIPKEFHRMITRGYELMIVINVLNEGWVADPTNRNEYRHTPWVEIVVDKSKPSGFGFSGTVYNGWCTRTTVAARLSLRNSELAMFVINQFPDLLAEYLCG